MNRTRWIRVVRATSLGAAIVWSLVACQSVQTTNPGAVGVDRSQHMSSLVKEADLREGAAKAYHETLSHEKAQGHLNADPALTQRVRAISQRLIAATSVFRPDAKSWPWEVNVIRSEEVNAWCMPGGKIAVYTGLIQKLSVTDDELAAVLGHEIAHALREHSRERASEQVGTGLVIGAVGAAIGAGGVALDMTQLVYNVTFGLPNSRAHETEADRIGVELAARAGFDPRAAVTLWQKMGKVAGGGKGPAFLSTHPAPSDRSEDLAVYATRVMPLYEAARK